MMTAKQEIRKLLNAGTPGSKLPITLILRMMTEFGGTYLYRGTEK